MLAMLRGAGSGRCCSRFGSGEENCADSSAMRRKATCARLTMGRVPSRCSSGPFMYSRIRMKPLRVAVLVAGHSAW
ncbi:hypothetical protein D3C78_1563210 [compost metagenome]